MSLSDIGYLEDFPSFEGEGSPLCSETDPEIFFPVDPGDASLKTRESYLYEKEAKAICIECPYRVQCAAYALERADIQGIWGAMTQMDRRRITRRLRIRK